MIRWLSILAWLAGFGSSISFAQSEKPRTPLDVYIEEVREQRSDSAVLHFAEECGVDLRTLSPQYGFANDEKQTLRPVTDLASAYAGRVAYLIDTAAVWKGANAVMVEMWQAFADSGSYSRDLYCFDENGQLRLRDAVHFQLRVDGSLLFGIHTRWSRPAAERRLHAEPVEYIALDGRPTAPPRLTADDVNFVKYFSRRLAPTLGDLNLGSLVK